MAEIQKKIERCNFWIEHYERQLRDFPPTSKLGYMCLGAMIAKWQKEKLIAQQKQKELSQKEGE